MLTTRHTGPNIPTISLAVAMSLCAGLYGSTALALGTSDISRTYNGTIECRAYVDHSPGHYACEEGVDTYLTGLGGQAVGVKTLSGFSGGTEGSANNLVVAACLHLSVESSAPATPESYTKVKVRISYYYPDPNSPPPSGPPSDIVAYSIAGSVVTYYCPPGTLPGS